MICWPDLRPLATALACLAVAVLVRSEPATFLTRITFPYLILISLVSLFSGILNSLAKFI